MSDTKGLYLGKSHAEGGIPAVNTDTGQHIEVEGKEYKICNSAYSSNKILRYSNKTNKEILDDIHDNFSCRFNKNEVKNGEFIICKVVVLDPTKRSRKGTVRQILDEMQSEKSCNVSQGAAMLKNGGSISSKKTIIEIDFGNYKENYVLTKDNLEDIWSILLNDKSVVGFAYINKDGFDLYDLEPNKTARVQQVIRLWNKSYKYEKESANYSYGGSYNREKMDKLNKLSKEYQLSANKLISKMNPNELMSLRNEADYDVFGNITEYEYGNSFKNGGEVKGKMKPTLYISNPSLNSLNQIVYKIKFSEDSLRLLFNSKKELVNEADFFEYSICDWKRVENIEFKTNYQSESFSQYMYNNEGVFRKSNHWGCGIATCIWTLDGDSIAVKDDLIGFAKWEDFFVYFVRNKLNDRKQESIKAERIKNVIVKAICENEANWLHVLEQSLSFKKGVVESIKKATNNTNINGVKVIQGAIMLKNGGEVESLISKSILELNFYETTPEHAKEFGIEAKKPLYVKNLCVSENERLKGIGKKVLNYLEDYARKNRNDVIFGYVARKASFTKDSRQSFFCDVDMIKNWLHNNGYAINEESNDFHKVVKYDDGTNTTFDSKNPDIRYEQGGEISEDDKIYKEWTELVNMSASELKAFMKTDEGKDAGLDPKEAKRLGIKSGQESARWIIKMKSTNKDKWTLTMWDWAKRQINFIKRMSGNKGKLFDENGMKTRKHTSLLIWGRNPMKYENGGEIKSK